MDTKALIESRMSADCIALMRQHKLNRGQAYWLCVKYNWQPLGAEAVAEYAAACRNIDAYVMRIMHGHEVSGIEVF